MGVSSVEMRGADSSATAEALQDRLAELEALYRTLPVGLCVVDRELRYVRVNQAYAEIVGRRIDEVIGCRMDEIVHPSARAGAIRLARRVMESGVSESNILLPGFSRDQPPKPRVWQLSVDPIRAGGSVVGTVAVLQNVTHLKQLERSAQARLEELESVYRNVPVGLALLDPELRYVRVNDWLAREHAMRPEDMLGKRPDEVVPPSFRAQEHLLRDLVGGPRRMRNLEVRMRPPREPDVEHVYVMSYEPVKSADGTALGLVASVNDVTERVRAEEAALQARLRAEERLQELETVYAHAPVGLGFIDSELRVIRANRVMARTGLRQPEAVVGRTVPELVPQLASQVVPVFERVIRSGQAALNVEVRGKIPERPGRDFIWLMSLHPVLADGGVVSGVICVVQDITLFRRQQDELESARARLEEAQRLAHVGSWEWNLVSDSMWWSDELFELTGADPTRLEPSWNALFERVHPADRAKVREQVEATLTRNAPYWVEFRVVLDTLEERVFRAAARLERATDGTPLRLVGTCQDVTALVLPSEGGKSFSHAQRKSSSV